jgi:hypothetical protein
MYWACDSRLNAMSTETRMAKRTHNDGIIVQLANERALTAFMYMGNRPGSQGFEAETKSIEANN